MREVVGNLWDYPATARCITTNGDCKGGGEAIMGRGCALEAAQRYPTLPRTLGVLLRDVGNVVHVLAFDDPVMGTLFSFPVKHSWYMPAELDLVRTSAVALAELVTALYPPGVVEPPVVVVPRPGCGYGQRDWEREIKPLLADVLDDRFHIIHFANA